jgi:hypothetical protein
MKCRYCTLEIDPSELTTTVSYWSAIQFPCHKKCKVEGMKQEAFDCQTIDADCNDCKHYLRGKLANKVVDVLKTKDGRKEEVTFQPNIFVGGTCQKFNVPTNASPNKWTGFACFEHRRS